MAEPTTLSAGSRARLVLYREDESSLARGRRQRRARVLAMRPVDPTLEAVAVRTARLPDLGTHWEYVRADGAAVLVRARDAPSPERARRDAHEVFGNAGQLRVMFVRGRTSGHLSWWLTDGRVAVFVAPRVWTTSKPDAVERDALAALAALAAARPPWGDHDSDPAAGRA